MTSSSVFLLNLEQQIQKILCGLTPHLYKFDDGRNISEEFKHKNINWRSNISNNCDTCVTFTDYLNKYNDFM